MFRSIKYKQILQTHGMFHFKNFKVVSKKNSSKGVILRENESRQAYFSPGLTVLNMKQNSVETEEMGEKHIYLVLFYLLSITLMVPKEQQHNKASNLLEWVGIVHKNSPKPGNQAGPPWLPGIQFDWAWVT